MQVILNKATTPSVHILYQPEVIFLRNYVAYEAVKALLKKSRIVRCYKEQVSIAVMLQTSGIKPGVREDILGGT
jgi:hypothetical protein